MKNGTGIRSENQDGQPPNKVTTNTAITQDPLYLAEQAEEILFNAHFGFEKKALVDNGFQRRYDLCATFYKDATTTVFDHRAFSATEIQHQFSFKRRVSQLCRIILKFSQKLDR